MAFKHPIMIEEKMDFDDMDDMICLLRQGCATTRGKVIEGFIPLSLSLVKQYVGLHPHLRHDWDDLCSEAFVRIVQAVDRIMAMGVPDTDNPVGYVSTAIQSGLHTFATKKAANFTMSLGASDVITYDMDTSSELLETILSHCQTERQKMIVHLRMLGHTDAEIAERLNVDRTLIVKERASIEKRYQDAQST